MSFRAVAWTLLAATAFAAVLLFNHWASFQPLSTLVYTGFVLALCGLANLVIPFRFLGVRKRRVGALILAGGVALAGAALYWPASTTRVTQPATALDEIVPRYQFSEKHSTRIHARREQVLQGVRQSTFGDLKSLAALMKVRSAVVHAPDGNVRNLQDKRMLEAFSESGYLFEERKSEIAIFGIWNARANRRPDVHTVQDFAANQEPGTVKMAFDFHVEESAPEWSTLTTETRVAIVDANSHGMATYWRLIVPGSGLLRLQWLEGIKRRAESLPMPRS